MPTFSLAGPDWFSAHPAATGAVVIDTRPAAQYWAGHLPGARHLDAALLTLQRTDAASVTRFQALLGFLLSSLGLQAQSAVLVYGAAGEVNVSRAAWALAYAGVDNIALLDGGLKSVPHAAMTTGAGPVVAAQFVVRPVSHLLATADEVQAAEAGTALIDAREREEFIGQRSNARRNGRIPGALHWDTSAEVDADGRLQTPSDLTALGGAAQRRIAYCGGGGRAARTFIALQLAGHRNTAVYPGSWNEWGNQDSLRIESGETQAALA